MTAAKRLRQQREAKIADTRKEGGVSSLLLEYDNDSSWPRRQSAVDTGFLVLVISDTHGMEAQLTACLQELYRANVKVDAFLHAGDVCTTRASQRRCLTALDGWLTQHVVESGLLVHRENLVVLQGNHDPPEAKIVQSGATYVGRNVQRLLLVDSGNTCRRRRLVAVPYGAQLKEDMPACDILLTHPPPEGLLDQTPTGEHIGNGKLKQWARQHLPPLWICGHVHESRGRAWIKSSFKWGRNRKTLVVNASNANAGRGTKLVHGPVLVRLAAGQACVVHMGRLPHEDYNDGGPYYWPGNVLLSCASSAPTTTATTRILWSWGMVVLGGGALLGWVVLTLAM